MDCLGNVYVGKAEGCFIVQVCLCMCLPLQAQLALPLVEQNFLRGMMNNRAVDFK